MLSLGIFIGIFTLIGLGIAGASKGRPWSALLVTGAATWLLTAQTMIYRWVVIVPYLQIVLGFGFLLKPRKAWWLFGLLVVAALLAYAIQLRPLLRG